MLIRWTVCIFWVLPYCLSAVPWLDKGREAFERGDYAQAAALYEEAPQSASSQARYNAATAYYQQGEWARALKGFGEALPQADPELQQKIYYNAGNTLYRLGQQQKESQPQQAIAHWEEGLKHYAAALELDPKDADAQFNHDFLKKKLEQLKQQEEEKKKQQEQQQNQNNPDKDEKNQQDKDKDSQKNNPDNADNPDSKDPQDEGSQKNSQQSGGDSQDSREGQEPEQGDEPEPPEQKESDKDSKPKQDDPRQESEEQAPQPESAQAPQPQEAKTGLSQEEAARILDAEARGEKQLPLALPAGSEHKDTKGLLKNW